MVAGEGDSCCKLGRRVWEESKKLWVIVAPAMFSRVVTYGMNVITQAFAGHLGDLELAAISIANTVVVGLNFGLMVRTRRRSAPASCLSSFISHRSPPSFRSIQAPLVRLRSGYLWGPASPRNTVQLFPRSRKCGVDFFSYSNILEH